MRRSNSIVVAVDDDPFRDKKSNRHKQRTALNAEGVQATAISAADVATVEVATAMMMMIDPSG